MFKRMVLMKAIVFCSVFNFSTEASAGLGDWVPLVDEINDVISDPIIDLFNESDVIVEQILAQNPDILDELGALKAVVEECVIKLDDSACGDAIVDAHFGGACRVIAFGQANLLLESTSQLPIGAEKLGDVVAQNNLYPAVTRIFEQKLNTPGFTDFVKNHVKFYKNEVIKIGAEARAANRAIYFAHRNPNKALIMHELTHIWQFYTGGANKFVSNYCDEILERGDMPDYSFALDVNVPFHSYGLEQQAEIIENYYLYSEESYTGCFSGDFLNCTIFSNPESALQAVIYTSQTNNSFASVLAASMPSGTKVAEYKDPKLGNRFNNCTFKNTWGGGGSWYEYNEYSVSCDTGVYKIGVEKNIDPYGNSSPTCKFYGKSGNIYGSGTCSNWRIYSY